MRNSILGFDQNMIVTKYANLDMDDILLLDYIFNAVARPSMEHEFDENKLPYVWLYHKKIHEDLPILNISEDRLKRKITKLVDTGLIKRLTLSNKEGRGSKSYYAITKECEDLRYKISSVENNTCSDDQVLKTTLESARPSVKNDTSNNKLSLNSKLDKTISINTNSSGLHNSSFSFGTKKEQPQKENLYSKCLAVINEFTDDVILQSMLEKCLQMFLDNSKESGIPFYTNTFKGKLNKLKTLSTDNYEQRKIVKQTIDNGWNSFHEIKTNRRKNDIEYVSAELGIVDSVPYTEEELKQQEEWRKEMERNGKRVKF